MHYSKCLTRAEVRCTITVNPCASFTAMLWEPDELEAARGGVDDCIYIVTAASRVVARG